MRSDNVVAVALGGDRFGVDLRSRANERNRLEHPQGLVRPRNLDRLHVADLVGPDQTEPIRNEGYAAEVLGVRDVAQQRVPADLLDSRPRSCAAAGRPGLLGASRHGTEARHHAAQNRSNDDGPIQDCKHIYPFHPPI